MVKIYKCFPGGKHKVLTMSYDDGKDEDRRLVEIFNQYGIKGTFHINSGIKGDPRRTIKQEEYRQLYKGHEVAAHTYNHPTIERCPMDQVVQQVLEDRKNLEEIMGYPVRGLSYPNGSYSKEIEELLPHLGIKYSRVVGSSESFAMPRNLYEWQATCHHNNKLQQLGEQFVALNKTQYLYMMYVWGHSYEFADRNNWEVIEDFCKLVGNREDTWYATNIEIVDYMTVLDRVQFSAAGTFAYNPSVQSAWFSIDGKIVEIKGGEQVTFA
jgi:peptidoglycan/xylan/chitin deacetylase (PgdA/CDA1 family)